MNATIFGAGLIGILAARLLLVFMWWLLQVIANWNIYKKAGEAGWKSIIPLYGDYISFRIAWKGAFYWLWLLSAAACYLASCFIVSADGTVNMMAYALAMSALVFAIGIFAAKTMRKARAFGKGSLFGIGMIFFTPIFNLILGFGSAKYGGPQP